MDSILFRLQCEMRMTAVHNLSSAHLSVRQGACLHVG